MLHIVNIDSCNFTMYGDSIAVQGLKVLSKNNVLAKAMEPVGSEVQGRIRIWDEMEENYLVNHKEVSQVAIGGVTYPTAQAFVVAFNALMNQCGAVVVDGVTVDVDMTDVIEAINNNGSAISLQIAQLIECTCKECNDWEMGSVESESKTFEAESIKSITIIVESGTVTISNGTDTTDLIIGQSISFTASDLLASQIIIDATAGKAIWAVIKCTDSEVTTTIEEVTTTIEEVTTTQIPD